MIEGMGACTFYVCTQCDP